MDMLLSTPASVGAPDSLGDPECCLNVTSPHVMTQKEVARRLG